VSVRIDQEGKVAVLVEHCHGKGDAENLAAREKPLNYILDS
jgi:hypothetical protein